MLKTCRLILVFGLFGCAPTIVQTEAPTEELSKPFSVEIISGPTATAADRVDFWVEVTNISNKKMCMRDYTNSGFISAYRQKDMAEGRSNMEPGVELNGEIDNIEYPTVQLEAGETTQIPASVFIADTEDFFNSSNVFAGRYQAGEKLVASARIAVFPCSLRDYSSALRTDKMTWITSAYSKPFAF